MQTVTTIGLDIAKSVFQVHDVDAGGYGRDPADWYCLVRGQLMRGGFPFFGFVVLS